jgi:hypothetical protein
MIGVEDFEMSKEMIKICEMEKVKFKIERTDVSEGDG